MPDDVSLIESMFVSRDSVDQAWKAASGNFTARVMGNGDLCRHHGQHWARSCCPAELLASGKSAIAELLRYNIFWEEYLRFHNYDISESNTSHTTDSSTYSLTHFIIPSCIHTVQSTWRVSRQSLHNASQRTERPWWATSPVVSPPRRRHQILC